ncbi:DUF3054 domain-containing protein [Oerskovia turbata]|uniref:DUF3054 domain-containing protein n=1 Tax=Oerskovia turbata TaxID=1713 RepID=A0A4Q1L3Z4_9CELL|nr:DUF3054 domain-containing protein [Oerskovia turbata]RXR26226.1 DUF3054 domain-containing protein [Oerskovia turbata]RXR36728.1 DUF3054 domain-containing protein [Oerskovia turbata]TGJ97418.1 DUF3054 domain-containing protein [Actinotalea fermentans ATCC 43279 = JCM 9966 = DSM 3133]
MPSTPATATTTSRPSARTGVVALALVLDVVAVLAFAAGGQAAHSAGSPLAAVLTIAWPFLVGLAVGWVLLRAWRRPLSAWSTGLVLWVTTWVVGMALRWATGEGLATAFLVVSAAFLLATLVGWRLVALLVLRVVRTSVTSRSRSF